MRTPLQAEAYKHRYKSQVGGLTFGFQSLDPYFQFVQGTPVIFTGLANMGKTNFLKECLLNLSTIQGKKHFVFSPEGSGKLSIINELIGMYMGKTARIKQRVKVVGETHPENPYSLTDAEWTEGARFVEDNFYIADKSEFKNPGSITIQEIYAYADFCGNFDTITIDAFNQLANPDGMPLYNFVIDISQKIKEHDRANRQSTFLVVHGQETTHAAKAGIAPYPMPVASNALEGGKGWEKFADVIVQVYVPQKDSIECEYEYPALIFIQKVREDDSGKKGVVVLGWCPKRQKRYYEIIEGRKCYGGDYLKQSEPEPMPEQTGYKNLVDYTEPKQAPF